VDELEEERRVWTRENLETDGFVKSPSAALRFNFVVAAYLLVRFTPQFLRAWHLELFTQPSFGQLLQDCLKIS
jgi:hypothetical protein